jgi:hypothetical protein
MPKRLDKILKRGIMRTELKKRFFDKIICSSMRTSPWVPPYQGPINEWDKGYMP